MTSSVVVLSILALTFSTCCFDSVLGVARREVDSPIPRKAARQRRMRKKAAKELIDQANDPSSWGDLVSERVLTNLPLNGSTARIPWTGSSWPTSGDSINKRWDTMDANNNLSPAEKYALAFNDPGLVDRVSARYGIDSQWSAPVCSSNVPCQDSGRTCSIKDGETEGRCIPVWFGICHAWSPASVTIPEPQHSIYFNGQMFKVQDIKALISLSHDVGANGPFIGLRCNLDDTLFTYDEFGRVNNAAPNQATSSCRDTNVGAFHLAITNMLGIHRRSFVADRAFDMEVWNHPVRSFSTSYVEITESEYWNELRGDDGAATNKQLDPSVTSFVRVQTTLQFIGGTSSSVDGAFNNCNEQPECSASCPGWSQAVGQCEQRSCGHYTCCMDAFTFPDTYQYLLELDQNKTIIGGEWIGASKVRHPDFLWLPTPKTDDVILAERSEFLRDIFAVNTTIFVSNEPELTVGTHFEIYLDHGCDGPTMTCHGECVAEEECGDYAEYVGSGSDAIDRCEQFLGDNFCNHDGHTYHFNCPMHDCDDGDCDNCGENPTEFTEVSAVILVDGKQICDMKAQSSCFVPILTGNEVVDVVSASNSTAYLGLGVYHGGISYSSLRMMLEMSTDDTCSAVICKDDAIANSQCDPMNNRRECNWDGGDCCEETCVTRYAFCGQTPYACHDPAVTGESCSDDENWSSTVPGSGEVLTCESVTEENCTDDPEFARHCPVACGLCPKCQSEPVCPDCASCDSVLTIDPETQCQVCQCRCFSEPDEERHDAGTITAVIVLIFLVPCILCSAGYFWRSRSRNGAVRLANLPSTPREPVSMAL